MDLYKETVEDLKNEGKTWDDIEYILFDYDVNEKKWSYRKDEGQKTYKLDKLTFMLLAKHIDYDNRYGVVKINPTLKIVGKDWWMTRGSYDGLEWWDFHKKPELSDDIETIMDVDILEEVLYQEE